jgi:signal transduction histidine kinase
MEVQELKLNPSQGDIIRFTREITQSFTDIAEKKNIQFSCYSTVESLLMPFDYDKLERILFNLLSNAFKFTPEHGKVAVQLQMEMENNHQRFVKHFVDWQVKKLRFVPISTWGCDTFRLFGFEIS